MCGPLRAALAIGAANERKLFLKIHVKIQVVISYVFACNKNKALQLQRVPILSILGPDLQNVLRQSYDYLTIMPKLRSTYDGRLIYETSYNEWKAFHR